jgi:hypothetical protein
VRRTAAILFLLMIIGLWPGTLSAAETSHVVELRNVRSLAAEAAEVLRLQTEHRVGTVYAQTMIQNAREQLQDIDQSAGSDDAALHREIADTTAALNKQDAAALGGIAQRLFTLAGPHGPAD